MEHCHAEIQMVNDDDQLNKIHEVIMDKSMELKRKHRIVFNSFNNDELIKNLDFH